MEGKGAIGVCDAGQLGQRSRQYKLRRICPGQKIMGQLQVAAAPIGMHHESADSGFLFCSNMRARAHRARRAPLRVIMKSLDP